MPRKIIAIVDTLANDVAGPLLVFQHSAPAIRYFSDVALHPDSQIGKHVEDYILLEIGLLNDDLTVVPTNEIVITGTQWRNVQQADKSQLTLGDA